MADATLKKLAQLIASAEHDDVRRAAIVVAAEVGTSKDAPLAKALLDTLAAPDIRLRATAIHAIGKLKVDAALPRLVEFVRQGGAELEAAAEAAGALGAKGAKAIEKEMVEANPVVRRRIASALALSGSDSAAAATVHALLDEDAGVVAAASRSLAAEVPALTPARRRALAEHLLDNLKGKRAQPLPIVSEAAMLRVMAALHEPETEEILWSRVERTYPPTIRATALQALGSLPPPRSEAKVKKLLECAADRDFQIAAPALMLLRSLPVTGKNAKTLLPLLDAPDVATRRFAVEKLGDVDDKAVCEALLNQLHHADRQLHDASLDALGRSKIGRQALVEALLATATPEEAWGLARAQATFAKELPAGLRTKLLAQASKHREADDRRAEPLFFLLREMDPDWTRSQIEERALALRKKKDYAGALGYLKMLARDPACGVETRFELAATGLKLSPHDLAPEARQNDPSLSQFSRLLQDPAFDVASRLNKAKWLDPDELFYLGFHFAEQNRREKEFGGQVLQALIKRSPKSNLAKDAKRKLKSEGLL